jgi:hypothetical protein
MITIASNCNQIHRSLCRTLVRQVILFNFLINRGLIPNRILLLYRLISRIKKVAPALAGAGVG